MRQSIATVLALVAALTLGEARAAPLLFDLVTGFDTASGPPYPTGNVSFDIHAVTPPPEPDLPVATMLFHLDGASGIGGVNPPEPDFPLTLTASIVRVGLGAVVSIGLIQPPEPDFPTDITIDPCWDVNPLDGTTPGLIDPPDPDRTADNSFFDLHFDMDMGDGSVVHMVAHFQIFGSQPFSFGDASAALGSSIDTSLHLLLDPGARPDPNNPLFTVTFSGDLVGAPEPATLALFGLGLAGLGFMRRRRGELKKGSSVL